MSRDNQKQRTRIALLEAAAGMVKDGHPLTVAAVAEAAMVSTATAYRYFPNPQSLWAGLAERSGQNLHVDALLAETGDDPAARMDAVIRYIAGLQFGDEPSWRGLVRANLDRWFSQGGGSAESPVRGETRIRMTRQVLEPLEGVLPPEAHRRLTMALMLVYGVEALIVTRDACHLEPDEATEVMRWAAQALIKAAKAERG
ncbi:TetR/AcrR family transcriptional regulator [Amycolatopsis sp.]|uniref:TetR/AcrR family transcriptional regulator n=1 Tax=Amycolatopsis sp. TaxID=37632 RepID=UPI002D7EC3CC|nr:TetR/AcrR family transcriptional regulator [Amycolatopsis sp.]HET6704447.1 TetR/AcrR family transcriptional regulator [Amycolatopsis sp.]